MSNFQVGDVVQCVDAKPSMEGYEPTELVEGAVYTVYAVGTDPLGQTGLFLDELESVGFAGGYLAYRFRKLPKADEQFTADLKARLSRYVGEDA